MKKQWFKIATDAGVIEVEGYVTSDESFLGIYRNEKNQPWTVTFLPTGTKIDTIFPERFTTREKLLRRILYLEAIELPAWCAITDLPWGAMAFRPEHEPAVARIKAAAQA